MKFNYQNKVTVSALLCKISIETERFFWLCLSLHACFALFMPTVCLSVCFSLLFFSSDRNKAWPGGNCRYLPITTSSHLPLPQLLPQHSQDVTWCRTFFPRNNFATPRFLGSGHDSPSDLLSPLFPDRAELWSQYLNIRVKRQYWERHLIAFRRPPSTYRRHFCTHFAICIKSKFKYPLI